MPEPAQVTVAVTTCGRPEALARCLEGVASGTARPGEVIVVDQAPSEGSRATAAGAALAVRHLEQPRLGLSAARNLALASATGAILALTDDDCVPDAGWLEALTGALGRDPAPTAVTGPILPLGPQAEGMYFVSGRSSLRAEDFRGRVLPWHVGSGGNFAVPVALLRAFGGWDVRLGTGTPGQAGEDAELFNRMLRAGMTLRYEPGAVVRHEWQTRERRLATRRSYGFGVAAVCGMSLRRGDTFALQMLASYVRTHARELAHGARSHDPGAVNEHRRALMSLPAGLLYGLRSGPVRKSVPSVEPLLLRA